MKVYVINKERKPWKSEHDAQLNHLHSLEYAPDEMAKIMGFAEITVRNKHPVNGLRPHAKIRVLKGITKQIEPPPPKFKVDPLILAMTTWGSAFDRDRMRLHGSPIKLIPLMKATNARLKANGHAQCLHNPEWEA